VNSFFDLVNDAVRAHHLGTDDRCVCGQPDDQFPWSEHVTQEIVDVLSENLGLVHEFGPDPDDPEVIVTRYVTEWRED
jgi:hypothetical protein